MFNVQMHFIELFCLYHVLEINDMPCCRTYHLHSSLDFLLVYKKLSCGFPGGRRRNNWWHGFPTCRLTSCHIGFYGKPLSCWWFFGQKFSSNLVDWHLDLGLLPVKFGQVSWSLLNRAVLYNWTHLDSKKLTWWCRWWTLYLSYPV